jgi:hypothetical protein
MDDVETEPRQAPVDQPGQRLVVVIYSTVGMAVVMWRLAVPE